MLITDEKLIEVFCECDDFCKIIEMMQSIVHQIGTIKQPTRKTQLSLSECICIMICYHHSGMKCFQYYYEQIVLKHMKEYFPKLVSYNRFVELIPRTAIVLYLFSNLNRVGQTTGCYFSDSKKLPVCHNLRINSNRVFKGIAGRSKSSTGWFYGFKLFLTINQFGQVINCLVTPANIADNNFSMMKKMFNQLKGYIFADKGYLSIQAFEYFYEMGLKIVTTIRSNMKNKLMNRVEKLFLKKRGIIESVNDILMTICDIDHTRHRSQLNFIAHTYAGVAAYKYLDKIPSLFVKKFAIEDF